MKQLKDNPEYREVFYSKVHEKRFYMPADMANGYHISRYVAGGAQDIFSAAGATKEYLQKVATIVKGMCNNEKSTTTIRTDVGTLMDNLLYRLQYPVDELCSIRMGAIFTFIEGEDPDTVHDFHTQSKVTLATGDFERNTPPDPELYTFFLTAGIEFTASYKELSNISIDTDYFNQRRAALAGTLPSQYQIK